MKWELRCMSNLLNYVFRILFILIGAGDIAYALRAYKEGKDFMFGLFIMVAVYMAIYLFKLSMET
jgi:hypothetical protein